MIDLLRAASQYNVIQKFADLIPRCQPDPISVCPETIEFDTETSDGLALELLFRLLINGRRTFGLPRQSGVVQDDIASESRFPEDYHRQYIDMCLAAYSVVAVSYNQIVDLPDSKSLGNVLAKIDPVMILIGLLPPNGWT